jgi:two-component system response regulator FixJ
MSFLRVEHGMSRFIYIIDDDVDFRNSLRSLLSARGCFHLLPFASGDAFLAAQREEFEGVILLDDLMPGSSGLDVLRHLAERRVRWPVIMLAGEGDTNFAVQAMKLGAFDYLEKPVRAPDLIACIDSAFARIDCIDQEERFVDRACERIARLSERELEVLKLVVAGLSNKQVAYKLDISLRTVEVHRANIMDKLDAHSVAEAIRLAIGARLVPLHAATT